MIHYDKAVAPTPRMIAKDVASLLRECADEIASSGDVPLDMLAALTDLTDELTDYTDALVYFARSRDRASWAAIGESTGVTRQRAHQKWQSLRHDGSTWWFEPALGD